MITLFHGTDQRIIEMSPDNRENLKNLSWAIINQLRDYFPKDCSKVFYLQNFYSNEFWGRQLSQKEKHVMAANLGDALLRIDAQKNGSKLYQYGNFYVTGNREKAANYASRSFAFGELGLTAFRLIESAISLGIEKIGSYGIKEYASALLELALGEHRPVIYSIHCDESLLKNEDGTDPIYYKDKLIGDCFRYDGSVDFSDLDVEYTPLEYWAIKI